MDDPHLYNEGVDGVIRRCVPEHEQEQILRKSHSEAYGVHHAGDRTVHHVILLKALLYSYELNNLDACWIAVDVWSNSSRCRIVSVYLSRT